MIKSRTCIELRRCFDALQCASCFPNLIQSIYRNISALGHMRHEYRVVYISTNPIQRINPEHLPAIYEDIDNTSIELWLIQPQAAMQRVLPQRRESFKNRPSAIRLHSYGHNIHICFILHNFYLSRETHCIHQLSLP